MATWKKIVVSGSNISQLNNDSQYLISGDSGIELSGSFTGSFDGEFVGVLTDGTTATTQTNGDNSTKVATTAYVDAVVTDADLDLIGDGSTTTAVDLDSQTLSFIGNDGLELSASAQTITATIKDGGIANVKLLHDSVIIGSTEVDLGTTATTIASLTLTGAEGSGSFSGSFEGDGSGLTGVNIDTANQLEDGNGIADFSFNGSTPNVKVTVQADSTTGGNIKPVSVGANGVGLDVDSIDGIGLSANGSGLLDVDYGSTAGTAVEGNTTITITGTTGEIGITETNAQALGSAPSYTITLPDTIVDDRTFQDNVVISGDLTVQGTASFQHNEELQVADRFIIMASGSNATGDGGIVIQQATQNVGEVFGFDAATTRWAIDSGFDASNTAFTPEAFMSATINTAGNDPNDVNDPGATYNKKGNTYVASNSEDIWIYS
jgi:hypothetical protein